MARLGLMACAAALAAPVMPAQAAGVRAGSVTFVAGGGSSATRAGGGSATVFSLELPKNASCPGDSADENYRVQSYLVPASVDPATLRYKSQAPDAPGGWALYKVTTSAYIQEQTANAEELGDPGVILDLPDLSFEVWEGAEPLVGRYRVGVACTLLTETVKYWGTEIVFTEDPADEPAHFRWRVIGAAESRSEDRGAIPLVVAVAVVLVGAAFFIARRARRGQSKAQG